MFISQGFGSMGMAFTATHRPLYLIWVCHGLVQPFKSSSRLEEEAALLTCAAQTVPMPPAVVVATWKKRTTASDSIHAVLTSRAGPLPKQCPSLGNVDATAVHVYWKFISVRINAQSAQSSLDPESATHHRFFWSVHFSTTALLHWDSCGTSLKCGQLWQGVLSKSISRQRCTFFRTQRSSCKSLPAVSEFWKTSFWMQLPSSWRAMKGCRAHGTDICQARERRKAKTRSTRWRMQMNIAMYLGVKPKDLKS